VRSSPPRGLAALKGNSGPRWIGAGSGPGPGPEAARVDLPRGAPSSRGSLSLLRDRTGSDRLDRLTPKRAMSGPRGRVLAEGDSWISRRANTTISSER
jgi:hypothetical protein